MTFAKLLDQVGGSGRFQVINVTLLSVPLLFMACHNLLQNFTAAVPGHRCHGATNVTCGGNGSRGSDCGGVLRASIPTDGHGALQKCRRFVSPQWQLLDPNGTGVEDAEPETEPCRDGWQYDGSVFTSTIVTEVGTPSFFKGGGEMAALSVPFWTAPIGVAATGFPLRSGLRTHGLALLPTVGSGVPVPDPEADGPVGLHGRRAGGRHFVREPLGQVREFVLGGLFWGVGVVCSTVGFSRVGWLGASVRRERQNRNRLTQDSNSGPERQPFLKRIPRAGVIRPSCLILLNHPGLGLSLPQAPFTPAPLPPPRSRFGRKALLIWSYLQMAVAGSCAAFSPSFTAYCAFRFLTGMALSGIGLNCMSLCTCLPPKAPLQGPLSMCRGHSAPRP